MSSYFSVKTNKGKVRKSLRCVTEFCIDLTWGMVFLIGVFARIVKVTDSTQVINFWEKTHGKIHPHKVDKNYRESMKLLFFFFSTQQQNKVYCPFFNTTPKTKSFLSFFLCSICFSLYRIFRYNCTRVETKRK